MLATGDSLADRLAAIRRRQGDAVGIDDMSLIGAGSPDGAATVHDDTDALPASFD